MHEENLTEGIADQVRNDEKRLDTAMTIL